MHIGDIQSSLVVSDATGKITGKLKMVTSGPLVDRWGEGYFFGLDFSQNDLSGLTSVKVGLDPSAGSGLVELLGDPDLNGVFKVTDKEHQKFVVEQTDGVFTLRQEWELFALEFLDPVPYITSLTAASGADVIYNDTDAVAASSIQSNLAFSSTSNNDFAATGTLIEQNISEIATAFDMQGYFMAFDMSQFDAAYSQATGVKRVFIRALDNEDHEVHSNAYMIEHGSYEPEVDPYMTVCVITSDAVSALGHLVIAQYGDGNNLISQQTVTLQGLTLN